MRVWQIGRTNIMDMVHALLAAYLLQQSIMYALV